MTQQLSLHCCNLSGSNKQNRDTTFRQIGKQIYLPWTSHW